MNFENPVWLYLTPLIVLLVAGLVAFGLEKRDALLRQFAAERLLNRLTKKANLQRILIKAALILLACALIGIALARPQYGTDFVERKTRGLDIIFVLDSSRSMLATDLRPTRLERARLAIMDLVDRLESDRIGLVVFSGRAFLQTPPTLDYSNFRENLNAVGTGSISRGGSDIGQALREAAKAFPKDNNFKVVVLLTDGEDLEEQAIDTAREIAGEGIKVYSIGIGTPEGTYLKVRTEEGNEEFIRDASGQPVRSQLDEMTLRKVSELTGGSYSRLAGQSLEALYTSVLATLPRKERESELQETHIERYQWVLLAAVICLALETLIRRRKQAITLIVTILTLSHLAAPVASYAEETDQELVTEPTEIHTIEHTSNDPRVIYNQAHKRLMEGDYPEAMKLLETAIEYSDDIELERNALYNMAHASNQMGEKALQAQDFEAAIDYWKRAEELFKSANELDPTDTECLEDAKLLAKRRNALEEFLNQQTSHEQPPSDSESEQDKQEQQDSETAADQNQPDESQPSAEDESGESNSSQSSDGSSQQGPSESQEENTSGQQSSGTEDDENNASSQNEDDTETGSSENTDSEATDEDASSETDESSSEDRQQEDESDSNGEKDENASESGKSDGTQETSGETNGSAETQETVGVPEGMQILDAQSLLDSLRNNERLLPFSEPSENKEKKDETRDW